MLCWQPYSSTLDNPLVPHSRHPLRSRLCRGPYADQFALRPEVSRVKSPPLSSGACGARLYLATSLITERNPGPARPLLAPMGS